MSWAAHRNTTRTEDTAYCLLGIFGLNMPLLYGEGEKAFLRLQEEIVRSIPDLSILAWSVDGGNYRGYPRPLYSKPCLSGLLAVSPRDFSSCKCYEHFEQGGLSELAMSTFGLKTRVRLSVIAKEGTGYDLALPLDCSSQGQQLGVRLKVINSHRYVRLDPFKLLRYKSVGNRPGNVRRLLRSEESFLLTRLPLGYPRRSGNHDSFDISFYSDTMEFVRTCVLRIITSKGIVLNRFWPRQLYDPSDELFFVTGSADEACNVVNLEWPVVRNDKVAFKLSCKIIAIEWSSLALERTHFGIVTSDEHGTILDDIQNRFWMVDSSTDFMRYELRLNRVPQASQVFRKIPGTDLVAVISIQPQVARPRMLGGRPFDARRCIDIGVSGSIHKEAEFQERYPEQKPMARPSPRQRFREPATWSRLAKIVKCINGLYRARLLSQRSLFCFGNSMSDAAGCFTHVTSVPC